MNVTEDQIRSIVRDVLSRYQNGDGASGNRQIATHNARLKPPEGGGAIFSPDLGLGVFERMSDAVQAADAAFRDFRELTLVKRGEIIEAIRRTGLEHAESFSRSAKAETGMGRVDHKVVKHEIVCRLTPGTEFIEPRVFTGDRGLTLIDFAPFGVVGAITPSTHPTPTLINNAISILSGGNTVAFNAHPASKRTFAHAVQVLNTAIQAAGGPPNCLVTVLEPTIESGKELFVHERVKLILVTGGPAVVREALKAPKRAVCAGPGNPPVVVDETADIEIAAREITNGAAFDNNILCIGEKEVFCVEKVFQPLMEALRRVGNVVLERHDIDRLAVEAFQYEGGVGCGSARTNREMVGRRAHLLAERIGLKVPEETPLLFGEVEAEHPWVQHEQLMPFLPIVRVRNTKEAIDRAIEAEHGFLHTASIFSRNIENMSDFARRSEVSLFIKNGPTYAGLGQGGEGYTSFSIATPTGEGCTTARTFCRERRCTLIDAFRIV